MSPRRRRRSGSAAPAVSGGTTQSSQGVSPRRPHAGLLRRERRALLEVREDKLRDLGGLLVEMYSRGAFRDDLVQERCAEVVGIDRRLVEIDDLLHGRVVTRRCACGAPAPRGAHFCSNCGRQLDGTTQPAVSEDTVIDRGHDQGP